MPEIQVIFPAPASSGRKTKPRVLTPTLVARQNDPINWVFYNCDGRIQNAEIEFADQSHVFFVSSAKTSTEKKIKSHKFAKRVDGTGNIHGDVPDLGANRPVLAKYTVRGWSGDMKHCYSEDDPEILVNEP